jgi:hypothetical protein
MPNSPPFKRPAAPIHPLQRDAFLKALAVELERHPVIGPGVVFRCAAELQRRFGVTVHSVTSHTAELSRIRARHAAANLAEAPDRNTTATPRLSVCRASWFIA